ncbi:hypothetical protein Tco_0485388 [Tanacetum coccineum]
MRTAIMDATSGLYVAVPNPFDVVCGEKNLLENKRPIVEQTAVVVTPPSDQIMSLSPVPLDQVFFADALPPPTNARKSALTQAPAKESASKEGKTVGLLSFGAATARESVSKADDALSTQLSDDLPSITASKVREFILGISTAAPKRLSIQSKKYLVPKKPLSKKGQLVISPHMSVMGEFAVGSSHEAAYDLCSSETGLKCLVSRGSSMTLTTLSSTLTHSKSLISTRHGPRSTLVSHHISEIVFDPVEDSEETPCEDRFYASMSMDPLQFSCLMSLTHEDVCDRANVAATRHITLFYEIRLRLEHAELVKGKLKKRLARRDAALEERNAEIECLRKLLNEKPFGEISWLRLGFERAEREVGFLRKQVEELKTEAGKGHVDEETKVKSEFAQLLDDQQRRFDEWVAALDARLDKMVKETDEEFAPMLWDARETKKFIIWEGFRYFLNKFKERADINLILAYNPNATEVYAYALSALNDVLFPLLEQIEACAEQPFSYVKALLVMGVHESIQDEPETSTNPASGSTSFASGVTEQFIITPSIPYFGDAGAIAKDVTPVDEVVVVESDFDVLAGTALNSAAPDVSASGPSTLVIPKDSPFK